MPTEQSIQKVYEMKINEITFDVDYNILFLILDGWMTHEYEIIYVYG